MSWAEFELRRQAYRKAKMLELKKWRRELYNTMIAPYQDPKTIPKTENKFMPLPGEGPTKSRVSDETRRRYEEKAKAYLKKKNG